MPVRVGYLTIYSNDGTEVLASGIGLDYTFDLKSDGLYHYGSTTPEWTAPEGFIGFANSPNSSEIVYAVGDTDFTFGDGLTDMDVYIVVATETSAKDTFIANMNSLNDAISSKCGTTAKRTITEMTSAVESITAGGGVKIPSVSNLNVDEWGDLTFDEPDYSKLAEYNPTISYIVDVNGNSFETPYNNVNLLHLLVEGENTVGVTVKAVLKDFSNDTSEVVMFSIPQYTNPTFFTLEATTVDGVSGYKVTAYNGTDNEISIPPQNTDGLPILELNSINVPKINGSHIKKINSFGSNTKIEEINFPETTNTSFANMFDGCRLLSKVTNLNTSNATNANRMFRYCVNLTTIPPLDTSKVTNTNSMFYGCKKLTTIPPLDISKSTDLYGMFYDCSSLTTIPQLIINSVTTANWMFKGCSSLTTVPQLNFSNAKEVISIFYECKSLTSIPVLDISNATDISSMFEKCSSLTSVPLLNTSNVRNMNGMFTNCSALTSIPELNTSRVTNMNNIFSGCSALTTIPQLDTTNVTNMSSMFNGCRGLMIVPLLNTSKVTSMNYMFQNCERLTEIPAFDASKVNAFSSTFHNCISLRSIHMTGMKASFDISASTQFTDNDLHEIIDNLATVTSTQTLTMGATNLAKVKDTYVEKAANKGWTLA